MNPLERAILRTILYADVFDFPLTVAEIHHFLIHDCSVSRDDIERTLLTSPELARVLCLGSGFISSAERPELRVLRADRERATEELWPAALRYGRWLSRLPFVRMVALTGALAMRNARAGDDLDYLIVTKRGRVWLGRLFAVILVRWVRRSGYVICPNYVVAEDALSQSKQDLFIAHEVAQMVPLYGRALYGQMRHENDWSHDFLPNAVAAFYHEEEVRPGRFWLMLKQLIEGVLSGWVGDWLEGWEHRRKVQRFRREKRSESTEARLDHSQVKGHFDDFGRKVLNKYYGRLQRFSLSELPVAGD